MTDKTLRERKNNNFDSMADIIDDLYNYMSEHHVGAKNAIITRDLANKFNVNTRTIRLAMNQLMFNYGCPIISFQGSETKRGYQGLFIASNEKELNLYVEALQQKVKPIQEKIQLIRDIFFNSKYYQPKKEEAYV